MRDNLFCYLQITTILYIHEPCKENEENNETGSNKEVRTGLRQTNYPHRYSTVPFVKEQYKRRNYFKIFNIIFYISYYEFELIISSPKFGINCVFVTLNNLFPAYITAKTSNIFTVDTIEKLNKIKFLKSFLEKLL